MTIDFSSRGRPSPTFLTLIDVVMKSIYKLLGGLPLMVVSLLGLTSCDKWIYESFEDCPQAIKVGFYSKTECANQKSYPQRVTRLNIYAFDKNDVLYSTHIVDNVRLSEAYEYSIPVEKSGLYTVLSWGNLGDHYYDIGKVQVGKTTKQNILFRLRQTGKWGADLRETTLWYGESPVVQVERNTTNYERYTETSVNLREYTNRIAVIIEGVPNPEDYKIEIASSNGTYQVNGRVAKADSTFYPGETKVVGDSTCRADFTTLKLESGHKNTLIVTNKAKGVEMFRTDLVGVILSSSYAENINLRCLNDFKVRLVAHHCDCPENTYQIVEVWINDWLVHTYSIGV